MGTILIGVTNCVCAASSVLTVRNFGRKTLLVTGHFLMSALLTLVGVFSMLQSSNLMLAFILLFLASFQFTDGPLFFLYTSEVTVDSGLGFGVFGIKFTGLVISLTNEYLMDSPIQPHGVFWLYAGVTLCGALFFTLAMKETKGLTDKQKKELYRPKTIVWEKEDSSSEDSMSKGN